MHVMVASTLFDGKTELERQRMVNDAVEPVFEKMGLHALRITTKTIAPIPNGETNTTTTSAKTGLPESHLSSSSSSSALSPWLRSHMDVVGLIEALIDGYPVVLFMKGDKVTPRCGFSRQAISMISSYGSGIVYHTVDILNDQLLRQGLKEYSKWPTYPQLYVGGKFIGGLDVMKALDAKGELKPLLLAADPENKPDKL